MGELSTGVTIEQVADGNLYFNRSGMTISRTADIIAEILHGEVFGPRSEDVDWRRATHPQVLVEESII